jgi:RNA polymerase sigma-70 factor (ECF subfamily)
VGRWLYRIAHNLAISRVRRPRPVPLVDEPPERAGAADCEERWTAVLAAIGHLGESHREVIAKKHFGGCTVDQVAAELGVPPGTVRSRLGRAYAELRQLLRRELIED